jgi:tRNA(Ile)-lysidine synthase
VAAIRVAVRRVLAAEFGRSAAGETVLVACSGGADSLALAVAAGFVAPRTGLVCGLVTVDHGLQPGSDQRAVDVAAWARDAGFAPVHAVGVTVAGLGGGPEAAARQARYAALADVADRAGAAAVLLGHTMDDQAETVLLAMARGAGPRGLAGMPTRRIKHGVAFLRPLLGVPRVDTAAACAAVGLRPWQDPHNTDPAYTRARVRAALPHLVGALGDGVVANLARTASLLAADSEYLDAAAVAAAAGCAVTGPAGGDAIGGGAGGVVGGGTGLSVRRLAELPLALRGRVLHRWALGLGAPGAAMSHRHVVALDDLVTRWHGQGPVALPGGVLVARRDGTLVGAR